MSRLVVVALAALVTALSWPSSFAAQSAAKAASAPFPLQISGAVPGINLEVYVNNGKFADVPIDAQGSGQWALDLSNLGKVRIRILVDVCQDGQTVQKVYFVAEGETIPENSGCKRRAVVVSFWTDCGVVRLTLDLTVFGARVVGCGSALTRPQVYGPIAGGAVLLGLLAGGGGSASPSLFASTPIVPTPSTNTTVAAPPAPAPPVTAPAPAPVTPAGNWRCTACAPTNDVDRHELTLQFCSQLTGTFVITLNSPLRIAHPSPWVTQDGEYTESLRTYIGTGTGPVGRFPSVSARSTATFQQTENSISTGQLIVTLGENGVFPGGRPVTYTLSMGKQ